MELAIELKRKMFKREDTVIFDLCGTLYDSNTTFDFLDNCFKSNNKYQLYRKLSRLFLIRALNKISMKLFKIDFIRLLGVKFLKGFRSDNLLQKFNEFNHSFLDSKKIQVVHSLLNEAKCAHSRIILMSASLDVIVSPLAKQMGIEEYNSTSLEYIDGYCTGKIVIDLLGFKDNLVKRIKKDNGGRIIFISDNISDRNVIKHVNEFYAVTKPKSLKFWADNPKIAGIYEI